MSKNKKYATIFPMNTKQGIIAFIILVVVLGLGIWYISSNKVQIPSESTQSEDTTQKQEPATSTTTSATTQTNNKTNTTKNMTAILHTTKGDITIEFLPEQAPNTVANFVKLAQSGFYDGTKFHRVIKGFMNQGGDPLSKDDTKSALWGTGGPGYAFADEIGANNRNNTGTIAMANAGPNTNGSQFFINAADNNFLDTKHTVFGHVTEGLEVVMAINSVPTDANDRPLEPVIINSITIE